MLLFLLNLAGAAAITGTGGVSDGADATVAAGQVLDAGTGAPSDGAETDASTGAIADAATGSVSDGAETAAGSGGGSGAITGTGAASDGAETTAATATEGDTGAGTASDGSESTSGSDGATLVSGYTVPAPSDLRARYPAFTSVDDSTINYWIADAQRFVTTAWRSADYGVGILALAAHNMAIAGFVSDLAAQVPAGVSDFRMGPMNISFTPQAANAKLAGDFTSTRYGVEYATLLRANVGGPRIAPTGVAPWGVSSVPDFNGWLPWA